MSVWAIEAKNLQKSYGQYQALADLCMQVQQGEAHGLLGPNGAGKSTCMKIFSGLLQQDSGEISVLGRKNPRTDSSLRKSLGLLSDRPALYEDFSGLDHFKFLGSLYSMKKKKILERVDELVEQLKLQTFVNKRAGSLSKGQRQKLALANTLFHDPDLLILDEPSSGLDPKARLEMRDLIRGLYGKKTVIFCTHLVEDVLKTCQSATLIFEGRTVATGELSEVFQGKTELEDVERIFQNIPQHFAVVG